MNLDLIFIMIREFSCCQSLINFLKVKQNKSTGKKYRISKTKSNSKSVPILKTKCSAGTGTEKVIRYKSNSILPTSANGAQCKRSLQFGAEPAKIQRRDKLQHVKDYKYCGICYAENVKKGIVPRKHILEWICEENNKARPR